MMLLWCVLALSALVPVSTGINPGVKVRFTQQGLEYGRQMGIATLQQQFRTIRIPDMSGTERIFVIGKVEYSITGIQIINLDIPTSSLRLLPGNGVSVSVANAMIQLQGNWRVKYLRFLRDSGSFTLDVSGVSISISIAVRGDSNGRPIISLNSCAMSVASVNIRLRGGASWLYNLFSSYINNALRSALEGQICPLVSSSIADVNRKLQTLNALATIDEYAMIEYFMLGSPVISDNFFDLDLKGQFYNIINRMEPPFSPAPFSLPSQNNKMLYLGVSAFTFNSASFVYHNAGALSLNITDDMLRGLIRLRRDLSFSDLEMSLRTKTYEEFIPQIAKMYPGMMMKLLVKTVKEPVITFQPNNVILQVNSTLTAYVILPKKTQSLFDLNLRTSVSVQMNVNKLNLTGAVTLNSVRVSILNTNVGDFKVSNGEEPSLLEMLFKEILDVTVISKANARLKRGFPLPAIGNMQLVNPEVQVLKDYLLIGTDVQWLQ